MGLAAPVTANGRRPPSRPRNCAPKRDKGVMTRPIGRRRSDASPVTNAVNGWLARMPRRSRAEVPELPRSITSSGSARPPTPTPSTSQRPSSARVISAPIARSAAAVASTSSPSRSPVISVRPMASAPNISARCEIDLSPGTATTPASGAAGRPAISGDGIVAAEESVWSSDIKPGSQIGRAALANAAPRAHMGPPLAGGHFLF